MMKPICFIPWWVTLNGKTLDGQKGIFDCNAIRKGQECTQHIYVYTLTYTKSQAQVRTDAHALICIMKIMQNFCTPLSLQNRIIIMVEKLNKKILKSSFSSIFNQRCSKDWMLPKYSFI